MNQNNRKNIFKNENGTYHIPVFMIVIGFFINPLLGIGLLVARLSEDRGTGSTENTSSAEMGPVGAGPMGSETEKTTFYTVDMQVKKIKGKKSKGVSDKLLLGVGIFATFVGVVNINDSIQYLSWCISNGDYISYGVEDVVSDAIWIISGILMIFGSRAIKESKRRRIRIEAIVGKADNMKIAEIAEALSISHKKAEKYVQNCIDYGIWGNQAYIDMRSDSLVVRGAAPISNKEKTAQEAAKKAEEAAKEAAKKAEENLNEYDKVIAELRELNDRIPGEDFSAKISRLEDLTAKIFDLIQKYPDMQGKLRKFINYYLPTSLKLLRNYAQLDAQGIDGENITAAKRKIENTMDTMITAFEKQLDELFYSKNVDISAEIATMENLMKQDGLIDNEFAMKLKQSADDCEGRID